MLCSSYELGILVPPIFRMMSVVNFGQATSAIDFSSKLEEMFSTHEEISSYELGRVLSSLEHFYSEWVATLCSIAAFRWCRFLVDQRTSIKPIPGRICEESIHRRGPLYFWAWSGKLFVGVRCCRSCIFWGWRHRSMIGTWHFPT